MKAAIIGCNGYIGRHLCFFLLGKGWIVNGYDKEEYPFINLTNYSCLDLSNKNQICKLETEVDFIFYFSGITGTFKGYDDFVQYIDVNEKGLLFVLDKMRHSKSKARIIFPSTRLIYKGAKNMSLGEDAEKEFKTIYALNKWFGEQVIQQYNNYFGINYNIFRIGLPYGNIFDDSYSYGTVGFFLRKAKTKENIVLFGTGDQKRTFTHVEDICFQIYHSIIQSSSINQILNIEGETFSLKKIAKLISDKYNIIVKYREWPEMDKKLETGDTIFDATRINQIIKNPLKNNFKRWLISLKK